MGGERQPGIDCLRMRDHRNRNISVSSKDTASTPEDNRRVYKAKNAFLRLLTSFGKSVCCELRDAVICVLDRKQSELGTGRGSYAVILLVSPLGSLTIAKFNGMSVHCFVVAHFSCPYIYIFLRINKCYDAAIKWGKGQRD